MKFRAAGAALLLALSARQSPALADGAPRTSLRSRVGAEASEALLASGSVADRLRGLERLGETGTSRARVRLLRALETEATATPEERLTAVRALARFAAEPMIRRALARVLAGHAAPESSAARSALDVLSERTAALALARSGTREAFGALGRALSVPGRSAEAAASALVAYPPSALSDVLSAVSTPSPELVSALEGLGDQRAFETLRALVRRGAPELRARAAIALTALGDYETVELARTWVNDGAPATFRVAGARILALSHDERAKDAILLLLRNEGTVDEGILLALEHPDAALVPALEARLASASGDRSARIIAALGRAGSARAARTLARLLERPGDAALAAHALARAPSDAAGNELSRALGASATRRLAVRAATLRRLALGLDTPGFDEATELLLRSNDADDRAVGSAARVARDPASLSLVVPGADAATWSSVVPLLPLAGPEAARAVAERIARLPSGRQRTAGAICLQSLDAAALVPTSVLVDLALSGGAASPIALRALAARDEPGLRDLVEARLGDPDAWLRAHAAFGLGRSDAADATGLLSNAYRFETDPGVRRAIVSALSIRRPDSVRQRALALAEELDADPAVRSIARLARNGTDSETRGRGRAATWVPIVENGSGTTARGTEVAIAGPDGLALPFVTGPDGILLAAGLADGPIELRVAPAAGSANDSR